MYNEDNIYICVQVLFCNSNFLLNYRKKQRVKNWQIFGEVTDQEQQEAEIQRFVDLEDIRT